MGYQYKSAIDAVSHIIRDEGFRGLYKGLWPNLLKVRLIKKSPSALGKTTDHCLFFFVIIFGQVAPSIGTSFLTYEAVKGMLLGEE
jgi:hypothetical protein